MFAEFTKTLHHDVYSAIDPKTTLAGSLKGKNILVTGAGRGIGRAIAQSFAQAGARGVFLVSRTEEELVRTQYLLRDENPLILTGYYAGSISKEDDVKKIYEEATGLLGSLDVLVNCAGASEKYTPLAEVEVPEWWSTIETVVLGTFLMSTHFLNQPSPSSKRVIINIVTNAAIEPMVINYQCPSGYTIAKTAFLRLSQYLHVENAAKGVNCYMFHPGQVVTRLLKEKMPPGSVHVAIDSPFLAGGMAVWFASELNDPSVDRAWLGGRYISAVWDVDELLQRKEDILTKDLLRLRLDM